MSLCHCVIVPLCTSIVPSLLSLRKLQTIKPFDWCAAKRFYGIPAKCISGPFAPRISGANSASWRWREYSNPPGEQIRRKYSNAPGEQIRRVKKGKNLRSLLCFGHFDFLLVRTRRFQFFTLIINWRTTEEGEEGEEREEREEREDVHVFVVIVTSCEASTYTDVDIPIPHVSGGLSFVNAPFLRRLRAIVRKKWVRRILRYSEASLSESNGNLNQTG